MQRDKNLFGKLTNAKIPGSVFNHENFDFQKAFKDICSQPFDPDMMLRSMASQSTSEQLREVHHSCCFIKYIQVMVDYYDRMLFLLGQEGCECMDIDVDFFIANLDTLAPKYLESIKDSAKTLNAK